MHLIDVSSAQSSSRSPLLTGDQAAMVEWAKLALTTAGFLVIVWAQLRDGNFINPSLWLAVYSLLLIQLAGHLVAVLSLHRTQWRNRVIALTALLDTFLLCGLTAALGQLNNILLVFFVLNVAVSGFYFGLGGALGVALFSAAGINLVFAAHPHMDLSGMAGALVTYNAALFVVAVFAGYLKFEVTQVTEELEIKDQDIKTLKDLNQLIVENVGSALLSLDRTLKITQANRAAFKLFSDIGLVNKNISEVLPALYEKIRREEVRNIEGAVDRFEIPHLTFAGDKMILEVIVSPLIRKPYGHQGFVVLLQNLTEIKNLEFALRQQEKMAAIGAMAAGIAHEIRNPLASISGSVQLLAGSLGNESAEEKKLVSIMIKEIDRLNKLIAEFLDFVRPPMKVDDPVSINNLVKEVVDITRLNANLPRHVQVETEFNAQRGILGHYDKLKQALLNILINAYQALEKVAQGRILVKTYEDRGKVIVSIADNGPGMSRETMSRLFVPFHTTKPRGTGLGLAITHKIIEAHEAQIFVDSEVDKGTEFRIEFKGDNINEATHPRR